MISYNTSLKALVVILLLKLPVLCSDPVAPNCEANLSNEQVGIVFEWDEFAERAFGDNFRSGRYFLRYRKYSFPY
ncbi:MAG: hypothetical protein ABIH68_00500, partial [bacterium]